MTASTVVASPCTGVCTLDPATGWCAGCMRTLDEIAGWGSLDDRSRRTICKLLPARRAQAASATGPAAVDAHPDADAP